MSLQIHAEHPNPLAAPALWAGSTTSKIPGFAYPGGKKRIRNSIVHLMPTSGGIYAEPFAGRGNVFWLAATRLQFSNWLLNDIRTSEFFRALLSHGNTIEVPEHTREEFERNKALSKSGDRASILLAPYLTYNGAGYEASYRSAKGSPTRAGYERNLRSAHRILTQTQLTITAHDWKNVHSELGEGDFALYDPPYIRASVHGYSAEDIDHSELIRALKEAPYRWILCEYLHESYIEAFGPPFWRKDVQLCSTNFRNDGGKQKRVECLWRNYERLPMPIV
jgi:site-specific DNA-adenine methylase